MKKIILLGLLITSVVSQFFSQSIPVEENSKALLMKMTATWCNPCGYYNFITENIYENYNDSILFVACKCGEDPFSGSMHNLLNSGGGIPTYNVSGSKVEAWPPSEDTLLTHCSNFLEEQVQANIAFQYSIVGNSIVVNTTTKFFQDQESAFDIYYVGVMIVENDLTYYQNQYPNEGYGDQLQNRVLRTVLGGSIEDLGLWGDQIASGVINSGSTFDHTFTGALESSWIKENIDVIVTVWRRVGDVFYALSSEDQQFSDANISEISQKEQINVFPNPSNDEVLVTVNQINENDILTIVDCTGKIILDQKISKLTTSIHLDEFQTGVYFINYAGAVQQLIISK